MKRTMLTLALLLAATLVFGQTVIAYTSFEEPATSANKYVDAVSATDHALVNNADQPVVTFVSTGGEMGFAAYYTNTQDGTGLSDGDFIGVTNYTADVTAYPDGTQGYSLSDTDGMITVTFDPVTVTSATTVYFSAKYFINDTGWETSDPADHIRIWLTIDGSDVDLLNTTGSDVDDLGIEGVWTTLTHEATVNTNMILHFEVESNSASETVYLDDVSFSTGGAVPNPPVANAGADIFATVSETVNLDGTSSSDIDNNIATYQWAQTSGSNTVSLTGANTATASFTAPASSDDLEFQLIVTDSTGLIDRDTVAVAVREAQDSKLIISEYVEGSSSNKAIELYNVDSNAVNLSGYKVVRASNGGGWGSGSELVLSGSLGGNEVYVITNDGASDANITGNSDVTSDITWFNGNDAIGLFLNDVLVDVFGDPASGTNFDVAGISGAALDHTIIRKASIEAGNADWASSAGTNEDNSEWIVLDKDETSYLGSHTAGPVAYNFANATVTTAFPQAGSEIGISVDITPDTGIPAPSLVKVFYGTGGTFTNQADMWLDDGNTYAGNIPALSTGNIELQYFVAASNGSNAANSTVYSMIVAGAATNISDIHTNITSYDGSVKTVEGVITIGAGVLRDDRTSCYIQDESGRGLNLYSSDLLTDLTKGTRVKVVGEVDLYFSTVEIKDFAYSVVSTGNARPAAIAATPATANNDNYEGTLVTITGVLSAVQDFSSSKNMILTSGTDSAIVKVWPTTGIDPSTYSIGTEYAITGVGSKYSSEHQLLVGYSDDITDNVGICEECTPESFAINKAYPNPFNPTTTIEFSLTEASDFEISVYNIAGQNMGVLSSGYAQAGVYKYVWNAANYTSGVYFIRLNAANNVATQKVVLIK